MMHLRACGVDRHTSAFNCGDCFEGGAMTFCCSAQAAG